MATWRLWIGTPWAGRAGLVTGSLAMDDLIAASGVAYRAHAAGLLGRLVGVVKDCGARNRRLGG